MKGDAIRFVSGKYAGKSGWIDTEGVADDNVTPVIVNLGRKGLKSTIVYTSSIMKQTYYKAPPSYAHAVIQQCPDIEKNLVTVTRQLAKCDIRKDEEGFKGVMEGYLEAAAIWQENRGSKAMYRNIKFDKKQDEE